MQINKLIDRYLILSHSGVPLTQVSIILYDNTGQIGIILYYPDGEDLPENRITETGKVFFYKHFSYASKDEARRFFIELRQLFIDWNYLQWDSADFKNQEKKIVEYYRQCF